MKDEQKTTFPVEVSPPDISPYARGNTGVPYVTILESGVPGPNVMVNALTHGNEITGAHVLCRLLEGGLRPTRGRLTLSFANHEAFRRFDPARPFGSRFVDEDFNRLWSPEVLEGPRNSWELRRARELRPFVAAADFLLDLHSMHQGEAPLLLAGVQAKTVELGKAMGYPAHIVMDKGHAAGPRMRDYLAFEDPASPKLALLVECGQHWRTTTLETAYATTGCFLRQFQVADPKVLETLLPEPAASTQRVIQVEQAITVTTGRFSFLAQYHGLEVIPAKGTVIATDGGREIITPFNDCVLVMPALLNGLKPGQTAVRLGRFLS